jgi:hypothetical protein
VKHVIEEYDVEMTTIYHLKKQKEKLSKLDVENDK